ncbi:MAG: YraN family protein [Shimia sp.]|uniref:YraN family protein n=1 Tax=Shimia sp. TaxID=1954381 RepID=UPI004059836D
MSTQKQQRGQRNALAGMAAEDAVARHYEMAGMDVDHRRWRGRSGEIDLIVRNGDEIIFVEVKKSRDFARASESLRPRQMQRLMRAGEEFVGSEPAGSLTPMRFDVALVDDVGRIQILENALQAV